MIRLGDLCEATRHYNLAVVAAASMADPFAIKMLQINLAEIDALMGDPARALRRLEATFPPGASLAPRRLEVVLRTNRAAYRVAVGDLDGARDDAHVTLRLTQSNDERFAGYAVLDLAAVAGLRKDASRAARLLGFIDSLSKRSGLDYAHESAVYKILTTSLNEQLSEELLARYRTEGETYSSALAFEAALFIS